MISQNTFVFKGNREHFGFGFFFPIFFNDTTVFCAIFVNYAVLKTQIIFNFILTCIRIDSVIHLIHHGHFKYYKRCKLHSFMLDYNSFGKKSFLQNIFSKATM